MGILLTGVLITMATYNESVIGFSFDLYPLKFTVHVFYVLKNDEIAEGVYFQMFETQPNHYPGKDMGMKDIPVQFNYIPASFEEDRFEFSKFEGDVEDYPGILSNKIFIRDLFMMKVSRKKFEMILTDPVARETGMEKNALTMKFDGKGNLIFSTYLLEGYGSERSFSLARGQI